MVEQFLTLSIVNFICQGFSKYPDIHFSTSSKLCHGLTTR